MSTKLPVLYVSHGSPMLAVEPGLAGAQLTKIGEHLQQREVKAIVVISAHWLTKGEVAITAGAAPEVIYDFYGFPDELYELTYPAQGDTVIAKRVKEVLEQQGVNATLDTEHGIDHGAWVPLRYLYPKANLPVIQVSMPWPTNTQEVAELGKALRPLREEGVLIVASGSQTHNLRDMGSGDSPLPYVAPFVDWMHEVMERRDLDKLLNYRTLAPHATRAHPMEDHFLPLVVALAATDEKDKTVLYEGETAYNALSMDHYLFKSI